MYIISFLSSIYVIYKCAMCWWARTLPGRRFCDFRHISHTSDAYTHTPAFDTKFTMHATPLLSIKLRLIWLHYMLFHSTLTLITSGAVHNRCNDAICRVPTTPSQAPIHCTASHKPNRTRYVPLTCTNLVVIHSESVVLTLRNHFILFYPCFPPFTIIPVRCLAFLDAFGIFLVH